MYWRRGRQVDTPNRLYTSTILDFVKIDSIVEWLIEKVNEVNHGKVGVIFNIVDDKIKWTQEIYERTEKPADKTKPALYSR